MPEELEIELTHPEKGSVAGIIRLWEEAPEDADLVMLSLRFNGEEYSAIEENYFAALVGIRKQTEPQGWLLKCNGATLNVYPSGMILAMGSGEKAYRLTQGKPALKQDLVSIFDYDPNLEPATVDAQRKFFESWLESLGGK